MIDKMLEALKEVLRELKENENNEIAYGKLSILYDLLDSENVKGELMLEAENYLYVPF